MLEQILTDEQERVLAEERRHLRELDVALTRADAEREDLEALARSLEQLDSLFLLVVVGEFNSGKSTVINALLGMPVLEEGVTPTTTRIHRLTWGEEETRIVGTGGVEMITAPSEVLRRLEIVDTPGTNALDREHEAITRHFVPRSDLVLFVTSADRPFTESERAFLQSIREWGKKLVVVLNKIDFFENDEDLWKVEEFIRKNSLTLLGIEPEIFPVSARLALRSKLAGGHAGLAAPSRFYELETYLVRTLDEGERVRLKLLNPLGVGLRLAAKYGEAVEQRAELLKSDFQTLEDIELQLGLYQEDMRSEFRFRLSDVDNELHAFEKRGQEFFDDTLRLTRALDLLNKERVKADFERKVIAETPKALETKVDEVIDWMVGAELKQWQAISEQFNRRRSEHGERLIGSLGAFDYNRDELLSSIGRTAQRTVQSFDQRAEAERLAESVRAAVAGTAVVEVSALGLGTIFTVLATSQLADFTGILAASTVAVLGLFILPARRRRAKAEFAEKTLELRRRLIDDLTASFDREIERSVHRVQQAVSPYTRFVRAEGEKLADMRNTLALAAGSLQKLEREIAAL